MRHNVRDSKGRFAKAKEAYMNQKLRPIEDLEHTYIPADSPLEIEDEEDTEEMLLRDFLQAVAFILIGFPITIVLVCAIVWILNNI